MNTAVSALTLMGLLTILPVAAQQEQNAEKQSVQIELPNAAEASESEIAALVREALENNPALQAAERRVEALRHRAPQARALPDPTLVIGWNGRPGPFVLEDGFPPSSRNFGAAQTIPFPGKLRLRGQVAALDAEAAEWEQEAIRREIAAAVKESYYEYFYTDRALSITRENQLLLEKLAEMAEVRYRLGKGLQQDVLKAQLELTRILGRLTQLEQQRSLTVARLNSLLNREPEAPLPAPVRVEPAEFSYALPTLYQLARENDPQLAHDQKRIEQSQLAFNLAEKDHLPDFRVSYSYQQRPGLPDTHNVTVGVNLPVFYKAKQREGAAEAAASLLSVRRRREAREASVQFEVKRHYLAARAAEDLFRLYSEALTPQSALALEAAMSGYQVGKLEFLTVLDNFRVVLDSELDYYRELANYQRALARLEPLVGVELTE